jgi:hypothetical protein
VTATVVAAVLGSVALVPAAEASGVDAAGAPSSAIPLSGWAAEPVRTMNDNGGWCWFQGQRALFVDASRLMVGSTASGTGVGGAARSGAVEVATYDVAAKRVTVTDRLQSGYPSDDHNAPGLVQTPSGRVVAAWAGHNADTLKNSATLDDSDAAWTLNAAHARRQRTSYSNLLRVGSENGGRGRLYDFYRGEKSGHNALISDDDGRTWTYAGTVVSAPAPLTPYLRYAVDGGRIYFIASTGNPQQTPGSSVRAGYLENGVIFTSDGRRIGTLAGGGVQWSQLTLVKAGAGSVEGSDTDVWTADLVIGPTGPVAALTVKHPVAPKVAGRTFTQEYLYARWTGSTWSVSRIGWGGSELYAGQPSYSGNITVDPTDSTTVYFSSNVDPRNGTALLSGSDGRSHWEVYEASSPDGGASWSTTAVTRNSSVDNLRPVITAGYGQEALLWMRGRYTDFRNFNTAIVGAVRPVAGTAGSTAVAKASGPQAERVARTARLAAGAWTGGASEGLFVVGQAPGGSGFLLPAARGARHPFVTVPLKGTYRAFTIDVDGSGRDRVLLVDETANRAVEERRPLLAALSTTGAVQVSPLAGAPTNADPVVGDFNGDGRGDIVWYGWGSAPDGLWLSGPSGWTKTARSVTGKYRAVAGDFDGNGTDEVLWHSATGGRDYVWTFGRSGPVGREISVAGTYFPVVGDFDGNGRDDVYWQSRTTSTPSYAWTWPGALTTRARTAPATTTHSPASVGDFDGDSRDDVLFDRGGDALDAWWWSAGALANQVPR